MHDRFGIRTRSEYVAQSFQRPAQRRVIVDFTVEDNEDRSVLVRHRLRATREIDDTETSVAEAETRLSVKTFAVGPTVIKRRRHFPKNRFVDGARLLKIENSGDPAHRL